MLKFNAKGLLLPNTNIPTTLDDFQVNFAQHSNLLRVELFNKYLTYSTELKKKASVDFLLQWIDGSYVTRENNPKDIDLVSFIDFKIVEKAADSLEEFKYPSSQTIYGVDGYIVKVYPINHKFHSLSISDKLWWMDQFNKTRRNRLGKKLPKGFLEIYF